MAHKYYSDTNRRDGGRDLIDGRRDMRDVGRDFRDGGRDLRDGGRDLRDGGRDLRDGVRDNSHSRDGGGRDKGYTVQDFPPPSKNFFFTTL